MRYNTSKFDALVHYICTRCDTSAKLGSTKLNKVLYFSDMFYYGYFKKSITGSSYIKRQYGPVPNRILASIQRLESAGKIQVRNVPFFDYTKRKFQSLQDPDSSRFNTDEINTIEICIKFVCDNHTATEISKISHTAIWEAAEIGEVLPYESFFAAYAGEIDEADVKWANSKLRSIKQVA